MPFVERHWRSSLFLGIPPWRALTIGEEARKVFVQVACIAVIDRSGGL